MSELVSTGSAAAARAELRRTLAEDVERFKRAGNKVQVVPTGVTAFDESPEGQRMLNHRLRAARSKKTHFGRRKRTRNA